MSPPAPDDPPPPALRLRGVSKRFGRTWALRSVDLRLERGRLLALVGPNGAGKSTLLNILATLMKPTEGRVRVLGHAPDRESRRIREKVGLLSPRGYLYDELTARENLRFAALMSGIGEWRDPAGRALERVGLARAADLRVGGYSSGMRKRLALARLLIRPLEMVLLDEPYVSLDAEGVELVDGLVEEMREAGRTMVLASHRRGRTLEGADRVAVLEDGRLVRFGSPDGPAGRPAAGEA